MENHALRSSFIKSLKRLEGKNQYPLCFLMLICGILSKNYYLNKEKRRKYTRASKERRKTLNEHITGAEGVVWLPLVYLYPWNSFSWEMQECVTWSFLASLSLKNCAVRCGSFTWMEAEFPFLKDKEEKEGRKEWKREGKNRRWKELKAFGLKTGRLERGSLKDTFF